MLQRWGFRVSDPDVNSRRLWMRSPIANRLYPAEIGPEGYDIHSPHVLTVSEMVDLLHAARERLKPEQIWINPDCGLKTRKGAEVAAARILRAGP